MKAKRFATVWVVGASLLLMIALPACGSSTDTAQSGGEGAPSAEKADQSGSAGELPESAGRGGELAASAAEGPQSQVMSQGFDRKIVKTAELGIRAEKVRESAARAQEVAARFDGSVLSSQVNRDNNSVYADLVLSVPSSEFENVLGELRGLGKEVTNDAVMGEDVTEEFVDLQSRERNLVAAERSLLKLYDGVESVDDALAIERELADIRGQIEQVQGRIQYLEQRTDFSQIYLSIQPVADAPPSPPGWDPARVVEQAWSASLGVLQALATAVISAVVFGWWIAPLLIAGFVWWKRRRCPGPAATGPSETG
jgi:hypothetical protein